MERVRAIFPYLLLPLLSATRWTFPRAILDMWVSFVCFSYFDETACGHTGLVSCVIDWGRPNEYGHEPVKKVYRCTPIFVFRIIKKKHRCDRSVFAGESLMDFVSFIDRRISISACVWSMLLVVLCGKINKLKIGRSVILRGVENIMFSIWWLENFEVARWP